MLQSCPRVVYDTEGVRAHYKPLDVDTMYETPKAYRQQDIALRVKMISSRANNNYPRCLFHMKPATQIP